MSEGLSVNSSSALDRSRIERVMEEALASGAMAGLSVCVLADGREELFCAGHADKEAGQDVTPQTLFQIGSITKVMTATLVMQAAREGRLDLNSPAQDALGEPIGHVPLAATATIGDLLCHMSGLDGDLFEDVGSEDDCLELYAKLANRLELMCPPGERYNYCNAGYALLGRIAERAFGKQYDALLKERLFAPLGMELTTSLPQDFASRDLSTSYAPGEDGALAPVGDAGLPRALGPAGLTLWSNAQEIARFASAFMGMVPDGGIDSGLAQAMQVPQATLPDGTRWAHGWKLIPAGELTFVGHDGGTIGQSAFLWFSPQHKLVVALCANGAGKEAFEAVAWPIFQEVCGATPRINPEGNGEAARDLSAYAGTYSNEGVTMVVEAHGEGLRVLAKPHHFDRPDTPFTMVPLEGDRFRATIGDDDTVVTEFYDADEQGRPTLFYAGRIYRRSGTA